MDSRGEYDRIGELTANVIARQRRAHFIVDLGHNRATGRARQNSHHQPMVRKEGDSAKGARVPRMRVFTDPLPVRTSRLPAPCRS
jgi:hypothetical protein